MATTDVVDIAHLVQMAVAPVFLLTGVGAVLSVLTTRLGRVIDRGRQLDEWIMAGQGLDRYTFELGILAKRNKIINLAITMATLSAFLVCSVILVVFASQAFTDRATFGNLLAALFVFAMLSLIAALVLFLREIWISSQFRYFGHHTPPSKRVE